MKFNQLPFQTIGKTLLIIGIIAAYFIYLGNTPNGFFCDEAKVGLIAQNMIHKNMEDFENVFFIKQYGYVLGALPVYAVVPFILLFGLHDFSVRLVSVVYSLMTLLLLYFTCKKQHINPWIPVISLAFSPLFFHISHIQMYHQPSLFFLFAGYYFYVSSHKQNVLFTSVISGLFFGIACYGYPSYMVMTPIFVALIIFVNAIKHRFCIKKIANVVIMGMVFTLLYLPVFHQVFFNKDGFLQRFHDKTSENITVSKLIHTYPKYFSYEYLFLSGEDQFNKDNAPISRHLLRTSGIFLPSTFMLMVVSFVVFIFIHQQNRFELLILWLFMICYPVADMLTNLNPKHPPYSFSLTHILITTPFIIGSLTRFLQKTILHKKNYIYILFSIIIALSIESAHFVAKYKEYNQYSSDYWGWQWGMKTIFSYLITAKDRYTALYITDSFNEPQTLLRFYDYKNNCHNCLVFNHADIVSVFNPNAKQLFVIRSEEFNTVIDKMKKPYHVMYVLHYPDDSDAFIFVEFEDGARLLPTDL